ncbi:MAG: putative Fe-S cluster assembly protein SufT [Gammaproteobacteria bacterium]
MSEQRTVVTTRDCPARLVPVGTPITIPANSFVTLRQALGGTFTVTVKGNMARVDGTDADALGLTADLDFSFAPPDGEHVREDDVWKALRTIYDPEIPVNIVDLHLVRGMRINGQTVEIRMTLTAPTCGMGPVLVGDVEYRVGKVPNVQTVKVLLEFDPPWDRSDLSDEVKLELGLPL